MPTPIRLKLLKYFASGSVSVSRVNTLTLPTDKKKFTPIFDELAGYHPGAGDGFKLRLKIAGRKGAEYLKIVPTDTRKGKWNTRAKQFLRKLKFAPVPDHIHLPERGVTLLLKKDLVGTEIGPTGWSIAHSRICDVKSRTKRKKRMKREAEVVFNWQHTAYPEYVGTCWKWFVKPK